MRAIFKPHSCNSFPFVQYYLSSSAVNANGNNEEASWITYTFPACPLRMSRIGRFSLCSYSNNVCRQIPQGEMGCLLSPFSL